MIASQLMQRIREQSSLAHGEIDHTHRSLRHAGLIPTSVRGGVAKVITAEDAAWLLIGIACGAPAAYAGHTAALWGGMIPRDNSTGFPTFGAALASILSDTGGKLAVAEVRIGSDYPAAKIVTSAAAYEFGFADHADAQAAGLRMAPIRREFALAGSALRQLAIEIAGLNAGTLTTLPAYQTPPRGGRRARVDEHEQGANATAHITITRQPARFSEDCTL